MLKLSLNIDGLWEEMDKSESEKEKDWDILPECVISYFLLFLSGALISGGAVVLFSTINVFGLFKNWYIFLIWLHYMLKH